MSRPEFDRVRHFQTAPAPVEIKNHNIVDKNKLTSRWPACRFEPKLQARSNADRPHPIALSPSRAESLKFKESKMSNPQEPNTTNESDVEPYQEPNTTNIQEPNTESIQEPNTESIQEPNTTN
jgi:hypothetical protein